ncbi:hypothetical protein E2562_017296 [Oryza meyeriana var. granulata]|uniref:Uncharacterized protein n=1 Tax=Oryza meyeriana var. granulata TaxID=110450 RepID=A0A6G1EM88_9ORYZ|nr:hypothetical protein E2562_017296 [Oryza meyeriana var. granulata]
MAALDGGVRCSEARSSWWRPPPPYLLAPPPHAAMEDFLARSGASSMPSCRVGDGLGLASLGDERLVGSPAATVDLCYCRYRHDGGGQEAAVGVLKLHAFSSRQEGGTSAAGDLLAPAE